MHGEWPTVGAAGRFVRFGVREAAHRERLHQFNLVEIGGFIGDSDLRDATDVSFATRSKGRS